MRNNFALCFFFEMVDSICFYIKISVIAGKKESPSVI